MRQRFTWALCNHVGFELVATQRQLQLRLVAEHTSIVLDGRSVCLIHDVLLARHRVCPHSLTQSPGSTPSLDPKDSLPPRSALSKHFAQSSWKTLISSHCRAGRHQWWQPLLVPIQNVTAFCGICKVTGTLAGSRDRQLKDGGFQGR